jgi:acyl-CoA synthetase (AMP-forming)/AMP-acid ligase II
VPGSLRQLGSAAAAGSPERTLFRTAQRDVTADHFWRDIRSWCTFPSPRQRSLAIVTESLYVVGLGIFGLAETDSLVSFVSPHQPDPLLDAQLDAVRASELLVDVHFTRLLERLQEVGWRLDANRTQPAVALLSRRPHRDAVFASGVAVFTSGTTGQPRPVLHTDDSLASAYSALRRFRQRQIGNEVPLSLARGTADAEQFLGDAGGDGIRMVTMTTLPACSIAGIALTIQAVLGLEEIVDVRATQPSELVDAAERWNVSSLGLTPFDAQRLLREWRRRGYDPGAVKSLLVIGLGSSAMPAMLLNDIERTVGCLVVSSYGSTETAGPVAVTPFDVPTDVRRLTDGQFLPGMDASIDESTGELLIRSPSLAAGHLTSEGLQPLVGADGWFNTGDIVSILPDGLLRFEMRSATTIKRGGMRIDPKAVEAILDAHDAVKRSAVCGVTSRVPGEHDLLCLLAVSAPISVSELRRYCLKHLGPLRTPTLYYFTNQVPLSESGEIDRREVALLSSTLRGQE